MLEKSNKISVLNKMVGFGEHATDSSYMVPQNSLINFSQKMGLSEQQLQQQQQYQLQKQTVENTTHTTPSSKPLQSACPHCENMAKNFLCLESLIRTNYNAHNPCSVCHSSLQYLQYVNKSIMEVFGNFDSVAVGSKIFVQGRKAATKKSHHSAPKGLASQKLLNRKNSTNVKKFSSNSSKANTKATTSTSASTSAAKSKSRGNGLGLRESGDKASSSKIKNKKKSATDKHQQQVLQKPSKKKHPVKVLLKKVKGQK